MEALDSKQKPTFLKDLFDRRFPQIIFIYLGVCWTILEFVSWIVEHYSISPYLTDLSFITLISMVPTVGMLAYFHGRPGRDIWTKTEKIGIPVNIVITIGLLVYFFGGKELGSATTEVTITNESGQNLQRQIPKSTLMKRLAIFFFENEEKNPDLDWLQYAFMAGCHFDLNQDPLFSVYSGYDDVIYQKIISAGSVDNFGMPMILEQKIAREIEREYFLGGSFRLSNDTLIVKTYLYETAYGKLIAEHEFRDISIFRLIDSITEQLKNDLNIPVWHRDAIQDLPVTETITSSGEAYRLYIIGSNLMNLQNNPVSARHYFEEAIALDPSFALAQYALYQIYINLNLRDQAMAALNTTMQFIYKFPESVQFAIKEEYYLITENPDKRVAVIDMWVQLYPEDIRGHFRLAGEYFKQFRIDDAITEYNKILKIDPARQYYLRYIGNAYLIKGDFKNALNYFKQYQQAFPKDYRSFLSFGDLYMIMGNYEKAREYYTSAQMLESNDITIAAMLALTYFRTGDYNTAETQLLNAVNATDTPIETATVAGVLSEYYRSRGEIENALKYSDKQTNAMKKYMKPMDITINQMYEPNLGLYVYLGKKNEAIKRIESYQQTLPNPWSRLLSLGYLQIALANEDTSAIVSALDESELALKIFGNDAHRNVLYHARGRLFEIKQDYLNAIIEYQKESRFAPTDVTVLTHIARCYRHLGDNQKANRLLENTISILPFDADAHFELAKISFDEGDIKAAEAHMNIALSAWKNAEPEFPPAKKARDFYNSNFRPAI